jgi:hypothetical protein
MENIQEAYNVFLEFGHPLVSLASGLCEFIKKGAGAPRENVTREDPRNEKDSAPLSVQSSLNEMSKNKQGRGQQQKDQASPEANK